MSRDACARKLSRKDDTWAGETSVGYEERIEAIYDAHSEAVLNRLIR